MEHHPTGERHAPSHLDLMESEFSQVVNAFGQTQPLGAPPFLSLWPDHVCHQAVTALVKEINRVAPSDRLREACYQFVQYTVVSGQCGPWGLRLGAMRASLLSGPKGPTRPSFTQTSPHTVEEDKVWAGEVVTPSSPRQSLASLDEKEVATLVRSVGMHTSARDLPAASAFVVTAAMIVLEKEMQRMCATEIEATFEQQAPTEAQRMCHCILLHRDA